MSPTPDEAPWIEAIRAAADTGRERFLVALSSEGDRLRTAAALGSEGTVVQVPSTSEALQRVSDEPFDIIFLQLAADAGGPDPTTTVRERRPFTDVVLACDADPDRCGQFFAREVSAILPLPLPPLDALLRAHLRWLASCRRSRARGLLVQNAFLRNRAAIAAAQPALASAIDALVAETSGDPTVTVLGEADLARAAGGSGGAATPDLIVVAVGAGDTVEARLGEARGRAPGAALVVVDAAPSEARVHAALYGGARAYLPRTQVENLGRVVASTAARRHAEIAGRKLVDMLARFGAFGGAERAPSTATGQRDVDARLIAQTNSSKSEPVVPTDHEILVVDDEAVVLTVLRVALQRGGYRVTTAASGEEAIDLMRQRRFDLVLSDKNLPGASGFDVLRAARALPHAPAIVLMTGYTSADSAMEAIDVGAYDYIEKPIRDIEDLRCRVRRALSRRDEQLSHKSLTPVGRRGRVLLVEVEGDRRRLMAEYLGKSCDVVPSANGDEALALLQGERFDLVLADRNLPGGSGLRIIEQARQLLPYCGCILYTAYPSYESAKEALAAGVDAYLVRPSEDLKALGTKVAEALQGRTGILLG